MVPSPLASTPKLIERVITAWHALTRLRGPVKILCPRGVGLTIRPANKAARNRPGRTGETFFARDQGRLPSLALLPIIDLPNYACVCTSCCVRRSQPTIQGTRLIMRSPRLTSVSLYLCVFESYDEKTSRCFRTGLSSSYWLMTNCLVNWRRAIPIYHPTALRIWRRNFKIKPISTLSCDRNSRWTYAKKKRT